jgi:general secretion pathway protein N
LIRSRRGLVITGSITLLIGLIVLLPARVGIQWFAPDNLLINGVSGTAWTGSVSEASFEGVYLGGLKWRLRPTGFLTGGLSYQIEVTTMYGPLESRLAVHLGGALSMSDLTASLPLNGFADLIGVPGLTGTATLTVPQLEFLDGLATVDDGTVDIENLLIPLLGPDSLGEYKADFFVQDNGLTASVDETDGVIDIVSSSFQVRPDGSFELLALVTPNAETPQRIRDQLKYLPANDLGQKELRLEGVL